MSPKDRIDVSVVGGGSGGISFTALSAEGVLAAKVAALEAERERPGAIMNFFSGLDRATNGIVAPVAIVLVAVATAALLTLGKSAPDTAIADAIGGVKAKVLGVGDTGGVHYVPRANHYGGNVPAGSPYSYTCPRMPYNAICGGDPVYGSDGPRCCPKFQNPGFR